MKGAFAKMKILHKYLAFPANPLAKNKKVCFYENGALVFDLDIPIDNLTPCFTAYADMTKLYGKELDIKCNPDIPMNFSETDCIPDDDQSLDIPRPLVHFTVKNGWNNDPNGLFAYNGVYTMFYQYNPCSTKWGNMHWGRADSTDLIHFKEKDITIFPDKNGTAYSGSAYIDHKNASNLQENENPPILLYYTAAPNSLLSKGNEWKQLIYFSTDGGKTFSPYGDEKYIPQFAGGNRDPRIEYSPELEAYVMVLFLEKNDVIFLKSKNLIDFEPFQKLTLPNERECPNFIRIKVQNENRYLWVLYGANSVYFICVIEDGVFKIIQEGTKPYISSVAYAGQDFPDEKNGRRIKIDWLRTSVPAKRFSQLMSVPNEIALIKDNGRYYLTFSPVNELTANAAATTENDIVISASAHYCSHLSEKAYLIEIDMPYSEQGWLKVNVFGNTVTLDFDKNIAHCENASLTLSENKDRVSLKIIADTCSCELYTDHGRFYAATMAIMDYNLPFLKIDSKTPATITKLSHTPLS